VKRVTTQVFIDDYVTDRLPGICVVTGVETDDRVKFQTNVSRLSPFSILLLFLGPVGWLIFLFVAFSPGNYIQGWLPFDIEVAKRQRARRWQRFGVGVGVAGVMMVLAWLSNSGVFVGLAVGAVVVTMVLIAIELREEPEIRLDASRRWVTLRRVHPRFADAVAGRVSIR
jgi:hypothetical protein